MPDPTASSRREREDLPPMSRTATTPRPAASSSTATSPDEAPARPKEGHRETVEALVVAFILALLVRGFEAEAFVIPTGSMAPTLMGRHKEVTCPECGHVYAVNASEEVEGVADDRLADRRVHTGICVNCRFQTRVDRRAELQGGPHPRDEVPLRPAVPPRRVGPRALGRGRLPLPRGARDQLHQAAGRPPRRGRSGSSSATSSSSRPGATPFRLERKPLMHQQAMQMLVYDDTHRAQAGSTAPNGGAGRPDRRRPGVRSPRGRGRDAVPVRLDGLAGARVGRAPLPAPRPRPRAVGGDPRGACAPAAAPVDADHRLLLVQHQPDGAELRPQRLARTTTRRGPGCSRTGWAT